MRLQSPYCESVYQLYEKLRTDLPTDPASAYENLCGPLSLIQKSIQNDIKISKEAVFLPYKASMWDSLESVWEAAREDPDWDVYVIPIPYYDRAPDGSFREMHYEGDQYPDQVPVTRYDTFDLI